LTEKLRGQPCRKCGKLMWGITKDGEMAPAPGVDPDKIEIIKGRIACPHGCGRKYMVTGHGQNTIIHYDS